MRVRGILHIVGMNPFAENEIPISFSAYFESFLKQFAIFMKGIKTFQIICKDLAALCISLIWIFSK